MYIYPKTGADIRMSKRACCLYRVSTKGQVEKNDIPMQRQKCHEFAEKMGWDIIKEFSEKGVSGFKVSAKDRDAIIEIRKAAALKEFDVLLVFMFDRLGRREDETPFVLEWFINNGIEVWSTMEGPQRVETHSDKLINYIRFWQASEESIKTSIRVKTRMAQIVREGRYRGGPVPFGYRLEKDGRMGKKNRELFDIKINPEEGQIIKEIFALADKSGYGGRSIASKLHARGIVNTRTGRPFHYATIQNILKNVIYMGILRSAESRSDIIPELQLIDPEQWHRVELMRASRTSAYYERRGSDEKESIRLDSGKIFDSFAPRSSGLPLRAHGSTLLSGNIYCAHCGGRMFTSSVRKTHHPGYNENVPVYKCYNRVQHKGVCDGHSSYRAQKVDAIIIELLHSIFDKTKSVSDQELVDKWTAYSSKILDTQLQYARSTLSSYTKELRRWGDLMLDSIDGKCPFTPDIIKARMDTVQESIKSTNEKIEELQRQQSESADFSREIKNSHQRILNLGEMFDTASPEEKRMIAGYIIKAVKLHRDYSMDIEFSISEAEYLNGMQM